MHLPMPSHFSSDKTLEEFPTFATHSTAGALSPCLSALDSPTSSQSIHELSVTYCKDFNCCGLVLKDLHALLQHYEETHYEENLLDDASSFSSTFSSSSSSSSSFKLPSPPSLLPPPNSASLLSGGGGGGGLKRPAEDFLTCTNKRFHQGWDQVGVGASLSLDDDSFWQLNALLDEADPSFLRQLTQDMVGWPPLTVPPQKIFQQRTTSTTPAQSPIELSPIITTGNVAANACGQLVQHGHVGRPPLVNANGVVEKPYKCMVPGCDKSYKNPNGLKYHNAHGHVELKAANKEENKSFKAVKLVAPPLSPVRSSTITIPAAATTMETPADTDISALLRRHTCPVCFKGYKHFNGIKYHLQHMHGLNFETLFNNH